MNGALREWYDIKAGYAVYCMSINTSNQGLISGNNEIGT